MKIYKAHLAALAVTNLSIADSVASHVAASMAGIPLIDTWTATSKS